MAKLERRSGKKRTRRGHASLVKKRMAASEEMAKSPTITVTLRLPIALNEWLDAYRHLSYPDRVGKQELVVEGLRMAYARRGNPGEDVLDSVTVSFEGARETEGRPVRGAGKHQKP
jgi:hypothetical protein